MGATTSSRCWGDDIEVLGEISHDQKVDLLWRARAVLFPIDWEEPFGLVMTEAMACGTPVIATRRGSVPEVIADGVTGWIVPVETCTYAEEAAERLKRLSRDRPRRMPGAGPPLVLQGSDGGRVRVRLRPRRLAGLNRNRIPGWRRQTARTIRWSARKEEPSMCCGRTRLTVVLSLLISLVVPSAMVPSASAAEPPSLRLFAADSSITVERSGRGRVFVEPGAWITPVGGTFELRATRPDYDTPVSLTQVDAVTHEVLRTLPAELLEGWFGLKDFIHYSVKDADGNVIDRVAMPFCANSYNRSRLSEQGIRKD